MARDGPIRVSRSVSRGSHGASRFARPGGRRGVDLQLGGFDREPYLSAAAEREFCYRRGRDVYQGGWLPLQIEPDPVGQQREPGDFRGPGVAGTAGLRVLAADDYRGGADCDEYVTVQAMVGGD